MKEHCGDSVVTKSTMFDPVSNQGQGLQLPQPPECEITSPTLKPPMSPCLGPPKRPEYLSCYMNVTMSKQHRAADLKQYQESTGPSARFGPRDPFC